MYSPDHPRSRWVCATTDWSNLALHHLLGNGSSAATADKKYHPQLIQVTRVNQLLSCEGKSCMFVINSSRYFQLQTISCV